MSFPRVLLVDDDAAVMAGLVRALTSRCALRMACATTPDQALEFLDADPYEVLVCDYALPGISAPLLFKLASTRWPEMRRVIYTGRIPEEEPLADAILIKGDRMRFVAETICKLASTPRGAK